MQLCGGLFLVWVCCYVARAQARDVPAQELTDTNRAQVSADVTDSAGSGWAPIISPVEVIPKDPLLDAPVTPADTSTSQVDAMAADSDQALAKACAQVLSKTTTSPTATYVRAVVGERHPMLTKFEPGTFLSIQDMAAQESGVVGSSNVQVPAMNGIAGATYTDSRYGPYGQLFGANWQRVGKLYARFGGSWYGCTASTIGRSLLVTAAHCVFNYGKGAKGWPDYEGGQVQVFLEPGKDGNSIPSLGRWWAQGLVVPWIYAEGTDQCAQAGVSCSNDLALIWLKTNAKGQQLGNLVGFNNYGWNGYSWQTPTAGYQFPPGTPSSSLLTQLGYPGDFDSGLRSQVSFAATYIANTASVKNIIRGTAMTAGSSGGPWIANLGQDAPVTAGTNYGLQATRDVVMGVTSWGFKDKNIKLQGASYFGTNTKIGGSSYGTRGAGNIGFLMYNACDNPAMTGWNLQSRGLCR